MDGLSVPMHGFKLLCGTGNRGLSDEIAGSLDVERTKLTVNRFADGEIFVRIDENGRGNDVSSFSRRILGRQHHGAAAVIEAARRRRRPQTCVDAVLRIPRRPKGPAEGCDRSEAAAGTMIVTAGCRQGAGTGFSPAPASGFFDVPVDHLYAANACLCRTIERSICTISSSLRPMWARRRWHGGLRNVSTGRWPSSTSGAPGRT